MNPKKQAAKNKRSKQQVLQASPEIFESWKTMDKSLTLLILAPLLLFGFMLNVRLFPMVAPNEEPKWAILTLCGVWIGFAAIWRLWGREKFPALSWNLASLALTFFYAFLVAGIFITPNMTEGLIRFSFWLSCLGVFLTTCWAWRRVEAIHLAWVWLISLGSFVFSLRYWHSYILDYGTPNYNISVLFSPIGHVNFTGDVLIILLPVLIYFLLTQTHMVLRVFNWCSVCTVIIIVLVASSRGALGGIVLGVGALLLLLFRHRQFVASRPWKSLQYWVPASLLLSALLISMVVYEMLPYHYRDLARVSATVESAKNMQHKVLTPDIVQPPLVEVWDALRPVLGARTPMYASAMAMAVDAPILGQGTGSFFAVYPKFSNKFRNFLDPLSNERTFTTNPHNIVLQIATQQGFVAMLLFMGLLLFFWWRLFSAVWKKWDMWQTCGVMAITAVLFDAMFNHVFFNPASMFVFALFAGCWWAGLKTMPKVVCLGSLPSTMLKPVLVGLMMVILLLAVWPTRWLVSEMYVGSAMSHARQPVIAAIEYKQAYAWDKDNFRAVFGVAQVAYQKKRYDDVIVYLRHFETIYPYNPPALNLLGAAYLMRGNYAEGVRVFKRALVILPTFKIAQINLQRAQMLLLQQH